MKHYKKQITGWLIFYNFFFLFWVPVSAQKSGLEKINSNGKKYKAPKTELADSFMHRLLASFPQYFSSIMDKEKDLRVQIIYTQIDRDKKNRARFTDHFFSVDTGQYFYPASTVKLPIAILALQRLNELKVAGLDMNCTMQTLPAGDRLSGVSNDPSATDGRPTIAHYIKKILLVSDNDAFNRLYEFLGQEYINNTLHRMGYKKAMIIHRLSVSLTEEENRLANAVNFTDENGKLLYSKPQEISRLIYPERNTKMGIGFIRGDELVKEPFDFSRKNLLPLEDLHSIVKSIMFPESVPKEKRFNLTKADYAFLRRYMSMIPAEAVSPKYDTVAHWDNYVKFLYYGSAKSKPEQGIRIFNKVGNAYGFLIDGAYIADFSRNIEFLLSAVIYCNSDGIFNDDKYDYDVTGLPFMKNLGRVIYDYELKRKRKRIPDLSDFRTEYR